MGKLPYKKPAAPKASLVIGRQPLLEALEDGRAIDKILFQQNISGDGIGRIRELARQAQVPIQQVPEEKLNRLTRGHHQGVIAFAALIRYHDLQQVIDLTVAEGQAPLLLMLDGVTDVRNIGGMVRTALCCGAHAFIIPDKGVGALNEEAMKASAGALEKLPVCRVNSLMKAVDHMHLNGISVYAADMHGDKTVGEINWQPPACIVMGSEDKGIFPPLMKICDSRIHIPMPGKFESLNVSVAAGMILYEAMKQRLNG